MEVLTPYTPCSASLARRLPSVASLASLTRLQSSHRPRRLLRSSVPPRARGTIWSTVVLGLPHIRQNGSSCSTCARIRSQSPLYPSKPRRPAHGSGLCTSQYVSLVSVGQPGAAHGARRRRAICITPYHIFSTAAKEKGDSPREKAATPTPHRRSGETLFSVVTVRLSDVATRALFQLARRWASGAQRATPKDRPRRLIVFPVGLRCALRRYGFRLQFILYLFTTLSGLQKTCRSISKPP